MAKAALSLIACSPLLAAGTSAEELGTRSFISPNGRDANAAMNTHGGSVMNGRCLFVASWLLASMAIVTPALARDDCAGARDVKLVNGRIYTLDGRNSIVSSVTIKDGKFIAVGGDASDGGPCM